MGVEHRRTTWARHGWRSAQRRRAETSTLLRRQARHVHSLRSPIFWRCARCVLFLYFAVFNIVNTLLLSSPQNLARCTCGAGTCSRNSVLVTKKTGQPPRWSLASPESMSSPLRSDMTSWSPLFSEASPPSHVTRAAEPNKKNQRNDTQQEVTFRSREKKQPSQFLSFSSKRCSNRGFALWR